MCSASGPSLAARTSARKVHACKVHAHKVTSPPEADFSRIWLVSTDFTIETTLLELLLDSLKFSPTAPNGEFIAFSNTLYQLKHETCKLINQGQLR